MSLKRAPGEPSWDERKKLEVTDCDPKGPQPESAARGSELHYENQKLKKEIESLKQRIREMGTEL